MKNYAILYVALGFVGMLVGCSKDPVGKLTQEETRLYITQHDSAVSFASYKTFTISDSVAIISNNQLYKKTRDGFDSLLINSFANALVQRGYTKVAKDQNPDLGINVNNIITSYTGYVDYGSYYSGYYDYWDPYYWGYPGYSYYGSYIGTYEVNEGVISIDMFDLKNAAANKEIKSVWNGVVRGEGIFNSSTIGTSVQSLIDQSVYLKAN